MAENTHGGNIWKIARQKKISAEHIIDLSSNVAPWIPPEIQQVLAKTSQYVTALPEPFSTTVVRKIADQFSLDPSQILVGAGTTEIIQLLAQTFAKQSVTLLEPTYADYRHYAELYQMQIHSMSWADFSKESQPLFPYADLVFICNPNNPTGTLIHQEMLLRCLSQNPNTHFVIDESYMPFVENKNQYSLVGQKINNASVLRSFSKIFGIPGIRIGWMYSYNSQLHTTLQKFQSLWSVNTLAQQVGEIAIELKTQPIEENLTQIKNEFLQATQKISWLSPLPSETNFVLCRLKHHDAEEIQNKLLLHNILIRNCANFRGLDHQLIRVSMKSSQTMQDVIAVFNSLSINASL